MNEVVFNFIGLLTAEWKQKITLYSTYLNYALFSGNIVRSRSAHDVGRIST